MSATVAWAKVNPVTAPQVLRLTSAVACCHVGFFTVCTGSPPSPFQVCVAGPELTPYFPGFGKALRMACTCGSPGLLAFWNSTLTSCAATAVALTIHCWYTSATSAA